MVLPIMDGESPWSSHIRLRLLANQRAALRIPKLSAAQSRKLRRQRGRPASRACGTGILPAMSRGGGKPPRQRAGRPRYSDRRCRPTDRPGLVELGVFVLCFFKDGDLRVGIFPYGEEVLVSGAATGDVACQSTGPRQAELGQRSEGIHRKGQP